MPPTVQEHKLQEQRWSQFLAELTGETRPLTSSRCRGRFARRAATHMERQCRAAMTTRLGAETLTPQHLRTWQSLIFGHETLLPLAVRQGSDATKATPELDELLPWRQLIAQMHGQRRRSRRQRLASRAEAAALPQKFEDWLESQTCPITLQVLSELGATDVLMASDGHFYSAEGMQGWIQNCVRQQAEIRSPLTRQNLNGAGVPVSEILRLFKRFREDVAKA